jgi:hypothetical protein
MHAGLQSSFVDFAENCEVEKNVMHDSLCISPMHSFAL